MENSELTQEQYIQCYDSLIKEAERWFMKEYCPPDKFTLARSGENTFDEWMFDSEFEAVSTHNKLVKEYSAKEFIKKYNEIIELRDTFDDRVPRTVMIRFDVFETNFAHPHHWYQTMAQNCFRKAWVPQTLGDQVWIFYEFKSWEQKDGWVKNLPVELLKMIEGDVSKFIHWFPPNQTTK